jgi:hypothetical protein
MILDYLSIYKPRLVEENRMPSFNIFSASLFIILEQQGNLQISTYTWNIQYLSNNGPRS